MLPARTHSFFYVSRLVSWDGFADSASWGAAESSRAKLAGTLGSHLTFTIEREGNSSHNNNSNNSRIIVLVIVIILVIIIVIIIVIVVIIIVVVVVL